MRAHWGVENELPWGLDLAFLEDESRIRKEHAPENMGVVWHTALNLLKQETTAKVGIRAKRFKANCNREYLLKVRQG